MGVQKQVVSGKDGPTKKKSVSKVIASNRDGVSEGLSAVLAQHPMNKLNPELAGRAITALLTFSERQRKGKAKQDLLDSDGEKVLLQVTLKRVPTDPSPKPILIPIPHPIRGDCDACLFIKQEDKPWAKDLLIEGPNPAPGLAKIISLDKLRTSYARFEQRRELLATYDLFLADDRILPMLCKTLGKTFFSRKKQPVPIKMTRRGALHAAIARARASTSMFLPSGTSLAVIVGTTAMTQAQLLANVEAAVPHIAERLPRKWRNVQAMALKTETSVSLPILNKLPFVLVGDAAAPESDDEEEPENEPKAGKAAKPAKVGKAPAGGPQNEGAGIAGTDGAGIRKAKGVAGVTAKTKVVAKVVAKDVAKGESKGAAAGPAKGASKGGVKGETRAEGKSAAKDVPKAKILTGGEASTSKAPKAQKSVAAAMTADGVTGIAGSKRLADEVTKPSKPSVQKASKLTPQSSPAASTTVKAVSEVKPAKPAASIASVSSSSAKKLGKGGKQ